MNEAGTAWKALKRCWLAALLVLLSTPVCADGDSVEFDVDDPPTPDHQLAEDVTGGAKLVVESDYRDDLDLDSGRDDRELAIEPELEMVFAYAPDDDLQLITELELQQRFWLEHPDGRRSDDLVLELKELYLLLREFTPAWSAQVGRQRFRDRREWLYDERLDGVRLVYRQQRWGLELAVTREEAFPRDLLNGDREPRVDNYELRLRRLINSHSDLDLYLFRRDAHQSGAEDLNFFGLHSGGEFASQHHYWLDAAVVEGDRQGRDILGYGVDLGWTYRFAGGQGHNLTIAFAYGSGDNKGGGTDNNFRQTGLQDNNARLQGLTKLKYYGELLEPELSNLKIATLGWGMRPLPDISVELLYHRYWQVEADDRLRDSNLSVDPNGRSRDLGEELDLVFATRVSRDLSLSLVVGSFQPGDAFSEPADRSWFGELSLSLLF